MHARNSTHQVFRIMNKVCIRSTPALLVLVIACAPELPPQTAPPPTPTPLTEAARTRTSAPTPVKPELRSPIEKQRDAPALAAPLRAPTGNEPAPAPSPDKSPQDTRKDDDFPLCVPEL